MNSDDLETRIAFLEEQGIDAESIMEVIPTLNSVARMQENIEYIAEDLGLTTKVFERLPTLFSNSIEDNLKPKDHYIKE